MVVRWRADDGPTLNAGLKALWFLGDPDQYFAKKPYIFVIFQGVCTPCPRPPPPLDLHKKLTVTFTNFSTTYIDLVMCKVYTDIGGIK